MAWVHLNESPADGGFCNMVGLLVLEDIISLPFFTVAPALRTVVNTSVIRYVIQNQVPIKN